MTLYIDFFVFKQKTTYDMRISDWSSDVCSSDLDSVSYHDIVYAMFKDGVTPDIRFYLICDRRFVWNRCFGNLIKPYRLSLRRYVRSGYVATGHTIRELAAAIDIDPGALEDTVKRDRKSTRLNSSH